MKTDTVELPRPKRARGGWTLYDRNEDSVCSYHQFCAFTGNEVSRCHICHGLHFTDEHGDLPPERTAPCLCSRCGELFTSITSFSRHKRPNFVGCYNPERRGLVEVEQTDKYGDDWILWANPGSRPDDI